MTSRRFTSEDFVVAKYDLLGSCNHEDFVFHVGLVTQDGRCDMSTTIVHMRPPLSRSDEHANVHGAVKLNFDDVRLIDIFIDKHFDEHLWFEKLNKDQRRIRAREVYCILPHMIVVEKNGIEIHTRFSCSGFVYEAYRHAGITLVDEMGLPKIDLSTLKKSYLSFADQLDSPNFRTSLGLEGDGPWPVMLCGYLFHSLFHSLSRTNSKIRSKPYEPRESDAFFS